MNTSTVEPATLNTPIFHEATSQNPNPELFRHTRHQTSDCRMGLPTKEGNHQENQSGTCHCCRRRRAEEDVLGSFFFLFFFLRFSSFLSWYQEEE